MRAILERYLEAKRLLSETAAAVKDHPNNIIKEGSIEVAQQAVRVAEEQLQAALMDHGLPSVEAKLGHGTGSESYHRNEALTQEWLQEKADRERRAQFVKWGPAEKILRASPQRGEGLPAARPRRDNLRDLDM